MCEQKLLLAHAVAAQIGIKFDIILFGPAIRNAPSNQSASFVCSQSEPNP